jgi:hypothetical protein
MKEYLKVRNNSRGKLSLKPVMKGLALNTVWDNSSAPAVPSILNDVLRSPGQSLDAQTRAFMEPRLGNDFSQVRIHSESSAGHATHSLGALAFTIGHDIAFQPGLYNPQGLQGKKLLAHELAHVVQQAALSWVPNKLSLHVAPANSEFEREAESASTAIATNQSYTFQPRLRTGQAYVQRIPVPASTGMTATPVANLSFEEFRRIMLVRYGVREIRVGTFDEQVNRLPRGGSPSTGLSRNTWQSFDPSTSPGIFTSIIEAFRDFEQSIGGVPPTDRILFFDTKYEFDPSQSRFTPNPNEGASFGDGELLIYRAVLLRQKSLPIARSNPRGRYRDVPLGGTIRPTGSIPGAPIPALSQAESANLMIVHELGHGLAEAAYRTDSDVFNNYNRAVGWLGTPPILYDIRARPVQQAIRQGTPLPPAFEITREHWNDPRWVEQPVSGYMVSGGPGEDFAEAVMTYVRNRELLRSRSPHRYEFIHARIARWLSELRQRPVGDFNLPSKTYA